MINPRIYVRKKSTGAIWSSVMPELGVWKKESLGISFSDDTRPVGSVTNGNFFPFSKKNRNRFELVI